MSWIKENQFVAALGGITLVGAAAIAFVGMKGSSRYAKASEEYTAASDQATKFERLPLYPEASNRDGKKKALSEYREAVIGLQSAFDKFRPEQPFENISPQELTARVISSNNEVKAAFESTGAKVPEAFFLGFEDYTGNLPRESATGILNYELEAAKEVMIALGESGPDSLINFFRPRLPEEDGGTWEAGKSDVSRALPFEVTFKGSEASLRNFLSAISKSEKFYTAIRTLRVTNEKPVAPKASDAKFAAAPAGGAAASGGSDSFGALFGDGGTTVDETPAEPAGPSSERILAQVLGDEDLIVFIRFDVLQFLPLKELPTISSPN